MYEIETGFVSHIMAYHEPKPILWLMDELQRVMCRTKQEMCDSSKIELNWCETKETLWPSLVVAQALGSHEPQIELWLTGEPLNRKSSMAVEAGE
ncbi:MAG TPA: hypothetical protein PLM79_17515 [Syntrophobacteraceae bacterium]|nr:hypothetical protein [Syntrophobacteraceae bacterium]